MRSPLFVALSFLLALPAAAFAQGQGGQAPPPVRYAEARRSEIRKSVQLPGTVQAHVQSVVATEVAGLVVELPAREGRRIGKGEVLARLRTDERELRLQAAQAQRTEAEARLDRAQRQLERARELIDSGSISQGEFDDAFSEYSAWQARKQQLEAEIARIQLEIERSSIRSLFDGTVVQEHTEVGEWIVTGGPVVEMVAMNDLEVRIDVPERWFAFLAEGVQARIVLEALDGAVVGGKVAAIIPRANPQARTFPVTIQITDRDRRIGSGMLASVGLPVGEPEEALIVPKDAVVRGPQGTAVWTISTENTVQPVPVEVGTAAGVWLAVQGDLAPGDRVVVRGNERLRPGQPVSPEAMEYDLP